MVVEYLTHVQYRHITRIVIILPNSAAWGIYIYKETVSKVIGRSINGEGGINGKKVS